MLRNLLQTVNDPKLVWMGYKKVENPVKLSFRRFWRRKHSAILSVKRYAMKSAIISVSGEINCCILLLYWWSIC